MKIDPYYQRRNVAQWIYFLAMVYADVRGGSLGRARGVTRQCGFRQRQFSMFLLAIFSGTLEMRPALLYDDTQSVEQNEDWQRCRWSSRLLNWFVHLFNATDGGQVDNCMSELNWTELNLLKQTCSHKSWMDGYAIRDKNTSMHTIHTYIHT